MSDYKKETVCKLCLNIIKDTRYQEIEDNTKEILAMLLLKLDFKDKSTYVMCCDCSEKLYAAFDFKTNCFYTDDIIYPYINFDTKLQVDLKEVFLKETAKCGPSLALSESQEICRLCFDLTTAFKPYNEIEKYIVSTYIPEINVTVCKDPVICETCINSMKIHSEFIKKCLESQDKINQTSLAQHKTDSTSTGLCRKTEKIDIKVEEAEIKSKEIVPKHVSKDKTSKMENYKCVDKLYQCDHCTYQTNHRSHLKGHALVHKNTSQIRWYKCDECDYKTKYKTDLKKHTIVHTNSEIQWYNCDECNYKTKFKYNLSKHEVKHKEGVKEYKCDKCNYKTKYKTDLGQHVLKHKDVSIIEQYKCDKCDFKTIHKSYLKSHALVHKDPSEIKWYNCDHCKYKGKTKHYLARHMRKKHELKCESPTQI